MEILGKILVRYRERTSLYRDMKLTSLISISLIIRDQDSTAGPKAVRDNALSKVGSMMLAGLGTTVNHACGTLFYIDDSV
jgi:hypothetical protein